MQTYRGGWAPSLQLRAETRWNTDLKFVRQAAFSALNKTGAQVQTFTKRLISTRYALSAGFVAKRITGRPLSTSYLAYGLSGKRRAIPLITTGGEKTFSPAPVQTGKKKPGMPRNYRTGGGTKVTVLRGRRRIIPSAFIATMPQDKAMGPGHIGVFRRTGEFSTATKGRYAGHRREKIKEIKAMSIYKVLRTAVVKQQITKFYREKIRPILGHELQFYLHNTPSGQKFLKAWRSSGY
jgi:hypothetical protein